MPKFQKIWKTCLITLILLILNACAGAPQFPDIHPYGAFYSENKALVCHVADPAKMTFYCDKTSVKLGLVAKDGDMGLPIEDVDAILKWGRAIKKHAEDLEQRCQQNGGGFNP